MLQMLFQKRGSGKMTNEEKLERSINELSRITGLRLSVERDDETDPREVIEKLKLITAAWKEKNSVSAYLSDLLRGKLTDNEIYQGASRFHIAEKTPRVLYLVETDGEAEADVYAVLRQMFLTRSGDMAAWVDRKKIALLLAKPSGDRREDYENMARTIVDMLNAEAMARVRVAFSGMVESLSEIPNIYRECEFALSVCRIFYSNMTVVSYDRLGLGRLLSEVPVETCRKFLAEVYGDRIPEELDEETMQTIDIFFANNLNISETARKLYVHRNTLVYRLEKLRQLTGLDIRTFDDAMTFRIALMVTGYVRDRENQENK